MNPFPSWRFFVDFAWGLVLIIAVLLDLYYSNAIEGATTNPVRVFIPVVMIVIGAISIIKSAKFLSYALPRAKLFPPPYRPTGNISATLTHKLNPGKYGANYFIIDQVILEKIGPAKVLRTWKQPRRRLTKQDNWKQPPVTTAQFEFYQAPRTQRPFFLMNNEIMIWIDDTP